MRPHRSSASLVRGQLRIRCGTLFTAKAMAASRPVVQIKLNVGGGEGTATGASTTTQAPICLSSRDQVGQRAVLLNIIPNGCLSNVHHHGSCSD
jgi:hypothetical protein